MNTNTKLLERRLLHLMGDVHFRSDFSRAIEAPDQLIAIGKHNTAQWGKIEVMGEEHQERIRSLFAIIIADRLQEEAITRYSNTNSSSIKQVLLEWFNRPEDRDFEERLREAAKQALLSLNLTEEQCTLVLVYIYDKLPEMLMEYIKELIGPIQMLPRSEAQPIAMVLADMMKEV